MNSGNSTLQTAGAARLRDFIARAGLDLQIVSPNVPMPTVPLAAEAIGVEVTQIIKSVLFVDSSGAVVLAVASGTARIDRARLATVAGCGKLRLADQETVLIATGYPAGGVSPIGHATEIPVVIDQRVMEQPVVYGGAGTEEALLRIRPAQIRHLTAATIADITEPPA